MRQRHVGLMCILILDRDVWRAGMLAATLIREWEGPLLITWHDTWKRALDTLQRRHIHVICIHPEFWEEPP